jgi:hypothetical protein
MLATMRSRTWFARSVILLVSLAACSSGRSQERIGSDESPPGSLPLERVPAGDLDLPLRGAAVVRDAGRWLTLWHRFGTLAWTDSGRVQQTGPAVDFHRWMLAVVATGSESGCSNDASLVRSVEERPDSILVHVSREPPDGSGFMEFTCLMIVYPLDVVRIPRSRKPVGFRGGPGWELDEPRWWAEPDPARIGAEPDHEREIFWPAWVRDPRTPPAVVREIARRVTSEDWMLVGLLLERPEVLRDPNTLAALAALERDAGRDARRILFDRHGLRLARDRRTPAAILRPLLQEFTHRDPPPVDVSRALARHPAVLGDAELLRHLIQEVHPLAEIRDELCRAYLARYPAWEPILDVEGRDTGQWGSRVACPGLGASERRRP